DDEAVVLSTIHQSKGLEFHAVFVLNLVEDRFPSARGMTTPEDLEEERRLFYVACTRAEQELYLTTPMRSFDRREGLVFHRQSLFIEELKGSPPVYETWRLQ
ncbi:MAG: DNA helicase-2/ATP-dependent DNA helicase PcrA, partial [Bradymonadia bacterium]